MSVLRDDQLRVGPDAITFYGGTQFPFQVYLSHSSIDGTPLLEIRTEEGGPQTSGTCVPFLRVKINEDTVYDLPIPAPLRDLRGARDPGQAPGRGSGGHSRPPRTGLGDQTASTLRPGETDVSP